MNIFKIIFIFFISINNVYSENMELHKADLEKGIEAFDNEDYATALDEFTPHAEQGDMDAQGWLGSIYYEGLGTPPDIKRAIKWFTLCAEQGDDYCQYNLGYIYSDDSDETRKDIKRSIKWLTLSAEQGNNDSQTLLGEIYFNEKDLKSAKKWLTLAAKQEGNSIATIRLFQLNLFEQMEKNQKKPGKSVESQNKNYAFKALLSCEIKETGKQFSVYPCFEGGYLKLTNFGEIIESNNAFVLASLGAPKQGSFSLELSKSFSIEAKTNHPAATLVMQIFDLNGNEIHRSEAVKDEEIKYSKN